MGSKGWCAPAVIYMVLATISLVISFFTMSDYDKKTNNSNKTEIILVHLIVGILWTGLLYWLCSNSYNTLAWIILLLPLILIVILVVVLSLVVTDSSQNIHHTVVLENVDTPIGAPEVRRF